MGIRYGDLSHVSHQKIPRSPTNLTVELYEAACQLFTELWNGQPIRHLGVHTGQAAEENRYRQLNFFDEIDYEKLIRLDRTVDAIRERFGADAVIRAAFLGRTIDHMSGGISREKRSVDYEKVRIW